MHAPYACQPAKRNSAMHLNLQTFFCAVAVVVLTATTALAGPLFADPAALPGWTGSSGFVGANGGFKLNANVEFAVYAPGAFGTSAALGFPGGADPSGGTQFVYAYEIFNN